MAKSGRAKQKEADMEYSIAKQVEKMIRCLLFIFPDWYMGLHISTLLIKFKYGSLVVAASLLCSHLHLHSLAKYRF